jgi:hypothetical protein
MQQKALSISREGQLIDTTESGIRARL